MTKAKEKEKEKERQAAIERLRAMLPPGATVRCVLRSVSRSGMSRQIDFYHVNSGGGLDYLSGYIATALDMRRTNQGAIKVSGCGMDMGTHIVMNVAYALYPDGFGCTGERCPSNDHSNGDWDYAPHQHKSGGYALRSEWI